MSNLTTHQVNMCQIGPRMYKIFGQPALRALDVYHTSCSSDSIIKSNCCKTVKLPDKLAMLFGVF